MAVKPSNLIYGVDDRPSLLVTLFLGLQHVSAYAISLIFPVLIVRAMGGTPAQAAALVSVSMIAGGIGTIVQVLRKGPAGSGYLCPQVCGPSFLTASILAAKTGGLSLVFGMTFIAGAFEGLLSRVMKRLRFLFPPEVTGLIVAMVGITVIRVAAMNFLGMDATDRLMEPVEVMVAFFTLAVMIGLTVWGKGKFKLFCALIGMCAGYAAACLLGLLSDDHLSAMTHYPLFSLHIEHHPGWSFDPHLLIPFIVAMLCSTLKSVGDITTCQKINDAEWKRPDMGNISKGILADSIGCMSAGLLGGMGQSTSSTNVGLSIASGATSRVIGFAMGAILIALAFFPKLASLFAFMPKPVMGATLIFALSFMVIAGFQIIMSRMIDARKTFVVGISLIFGLTVDVMPEVFVNAHHWIRPVFSSSLATATVTAIILNLLFRIGIAKKVRLVLRPGIDVAGKVFSFMDRQGRTWGARQEVIYRATSAITEFMESVSEYGLSKEDVEIEVSFDEFNLDVNIGYAGRCMEFPPERPDIDALFTDGEAPLKFAGFMVRKYADRVTARTKGGRCLVAMHFEH